MLQDIPSKFLIQLPGDKTHENRDDCEDTGHADKDGLDALPDVDIFESANILQVGDCVTDLINLNGSVDEKREVRDAKSDDLNGVLCLEGIPHQQEFVDEAEQEQAEEGRDRLKFGLDTILSGPFRVVHIAETTLESTEGVAARFPGEPTLFFPPPLT